MQHFAENLQVSSAETEYHAFEKRKVNKENRACSLRVIITKGTIHTTANPVMPPEEMPLFFLHFP